MTNYKTCHDHDKNDQNDSQDDPQDDPQDDRQTDPQDDRQTVSLVSVLKRIQNDYKDFIYDLHPVLYPNLYP